MSPQVAIAVVLLGLLLLAAGVYLLKKKPTAAETRSVTVNEASPIPVVCPNGGALTILKATYGADGCAPVDVSAAATKAVQGDRLAFPAGVTGALGVPDPCVGKSKQLQLSFTCG